MKKFSVITVVALITFSLPGMAKVKINGVDFKGDGTTAKVIIGLDSTLITAPELTIKNNIVQVAIPDATVWPKLERKISVAGESDATLLAYQFDGGTSRVRAILPFSLVGKEGAVSVTVLEKSVELSFPVSGKKIAALPKKNAENYDESYLDKLLKDKENAQKKGPADIETKPVNAIKSAETIVEDKVGITHSSPAKANEATSKFSLGVYAGKFVAFLGIILLFFYGVVALFKKGVLKKGRLGFLNDTQVIKVLNTTYLGPKKSIVLVQVHKQTFLLSVSDKDIQFLTEVEDTVGAIKEGEKEISGVNFDSAVDDAQKSPKNFKLKDITEALKEEGPAPKVASELARERDNKFTNLLKSKVKGLKPLQ